KIRMFVTDGDGVLTDAGMYYTDKGDELKKFNTRDGLGIRLLKEAGIVVGIITSEKTQIVERRGAKLDVDFLYQGTYKKLELLKRECQSRGIALDEVAYIGDDLNDLGCLESVGMSFAPADAVYRVKAIVNHVLETEGGKGAVR
ncbi:MAG: KdsC family phosphatase, partial [Verrucomicrobiales bacterium]